MQSPIGRHIKQQRAFRSLEEEVFVGLQLVGDRLMEPWARELREEAGLTPVQYNVLRILRGVGEDGLWVGEIGERLISRSPDVTRIVDRLEKQKLVRRKRDRDDRRVVRVFITPAGRERIAPFDARLPRLRGVFAPVGRKRLQELRDTLGRILDAVESFGRCDTSAVG